MNKLYVIGIGPRCPDEEAREIVSSCDVVIASKRNMERGQGSEVRGQGSGVRGQGSGVGGQRFFPISPLEEALDFIRENMGRERMVVLASGDPLFFGIGRRLLEEFGKEDIEFIPALSSIQLAFAKIKEPWDDVFFISLHGRDMGMIIADVDRHDRICIFTDSKNNPGRIAGALLEEGLDYNVFVCENLGMEGERIAGGRLSEISRMEFSDPNVMILMRPPGISSPTAIFGLFESEIAHTRGLITKDEVRAVTLHKLRIPREGILWDIGSGSGSVAIEAARMNPGLRVFAIEKEEGQVSNLLENKRRFSAHNIQIIHGEAPDALSSLPVPDRVFIGGSGGRLNGIIRRVSESLKQGGRVVLNATTIDTLTLGMKLLEAAGFTLEVVEVSTARTKRLKGRAYLSALNPVFILVGER